MVSIVVYSQDGNCNNDVNCTQDGNCKLQDLY